MEGGRTRLQMLSIKYKVASFCSGLSVELRLCSMVWTISGANSSKSLAIIARGSMSATLWKGRGNQVQETEEVRGWGGGEWDNGLR